VRPPPINEKQPETQFARPPATVVHEEKVLLLQPPPIKEEAPLDIFPEPPTIADRSAQV